MQVETTQPNREMPEVPSYAMRVVDALEAAGHEAWVVGGWVRDALMGRPGHDVDVTCSCPWEETERVLRAAGIEVHQTGVAHGKRREVPPGAHVERRHVVPPGPRRQAHRARPYRK